MKFGINRDLFNSASGEVVVRLKGPFTYLSDPDNLIIGEDGSMSVSLGLFNYDVIEPSNYMAHCIPFTFTGCVYVGGENGVIPEYFTNETLQNLSDDSFKFVRYVDQNGTPWFRPVVKQNGYSSRVLVYKAGLNPSKPEEGNTFNLGTGNEDGTLPQFEYANADESVIKVKVFYNDTPFDVPVPTYDVKLTRSTGEEFYKPGPTVNADFTTDQSDIELIELTPRVSTLGPAAFKAAGRTSILLGSGLLTVGTEALVNKVILDENLPTSIRTISANAFENCYFDKRELIIPNTVTVLGEESFKGADIGDKLVIGDGVTTVSRRAFHGAIVDNSIYIGSNVTTIENKAFDLNRQCKPNFYFSSLVPPIIEYGLLDEYSMDGVTIYVPEESLEAYRAVPELAPYTSQISAAPKNDFFLKVVENGISKEIVTDPVVTDYLYLGNNNITSVVVGRKVSGLGNGVFQSCTQLMSVDITEGISVIGNSAFAYCSLLPTLPLPDSLETIKESAFAYCTALGTATVPDTVTEMGNLVFKGCSGLTEVTIGDGVPVVGLETFFGCLSLVRVNLGSSVSFLGANSFGNCPLLRDIYLTVTEPPMVNFNLSDYANLTWHVPASVLNTYRNTPGWESIAERIVAI